MHFNTTFIRTGSSFSMLRDRLKRINKSGCIFGFLWVFSFLGILWVFILWYSVPTYTHYIYLDRLYSERPPLSYQLNEKKDDYYVSADYKLCLSSGAAAFQNKKTIRFYENVQFTHELSYPAVEHDYKDKKEWSSIWLKNNEPQDFSDILSPKLSEQARAECAKKGLKFADFKCGYFFLHRYQDDISRYNVEFDTVRVINSEADTLNKYARVSKHFMREYVGKISNEDLFVQEKDMPKIPNIQFTGESKSVGLSKSGMSFFTTELSSTHHSSFYNFWRSLFQMYDLTKAKYIIYLKSNAIDSVNYNIVFEEGVSFSDMNVNPDHKDMNSLTFKVADSRREVELSEGIKFFVEFLESSNVQYLRTAFLAGIWGIPSFLKILSFLCFKESNNQTPPATPEPNQEALRNRAQQKNKSRKKQK